MCPQKKQKGHELAFSSQTSIIERTLVRPIQKYIRKIFAVYGSHDMVQPKDGPFWG